MSADKAGQGSSAFRAFLRGLPDEVERCRLRGRPITCPDPGTTHGRRLLAALRVEIDRRVA